jgi:hypothetical protein
LGPAWGARAFHASDKALIELLAFQRALENGARAFHASFLGRAMKMGRQKKREFAGESDEVKPKGQETKSIH